MQRLHRFSVFALAVILCAAVGTACSSTPEPKDEDVPLQVASAQDLLQSDDVLVAGRVEFERLTDLAPLLQRLAQTADEPMLRDLADISPDPLGYLEADYELTEALTALDVDRPTYVMVSEAGNDSFLRAATLGIPTEPEEWPAYVNIRLLLPTDDATTLSTELDHWLDRIAAAGVFDAYQSYDGPGFVRVELAVPYDGAATVDGVDANAWLDELELDRLQPPAPGDFRPTPAFDAFVDGDAPLAVWTPVDAITAFGAYELLELFARDYHRVADSGKPRFYLEGVARLAAASVADDPVSAETEDVSVLLSADGDGVLFVDYYATRTEQGAALRQARSTPLDLPEPKVDSFVDLSGQANLTAIDEAAVSPFWTSLDDPDDFASPDFDPMADSALPFSDDPSGLVLLTMALQYPWTALAIAGDSVGFIPLPSGLRVHVFDAGPAGPLPASIALAATFEEAPGTRQAIEMLLGQGDEVLPGMLDAELLVRSDDLLEVRAAVGATLVDTFGESAPSLPVEGAELSIDVAALQQALPGLVTTAEALDFFGHLHLRGLSHDHYTAQRLSIGSAEPVEPVAVESRLETLAAPGDRCRTELAALATDHLANLRTAPTEHVERWADELHTRASECLGADHPDVGLIEERIDVARQLADEIP